MEGDNTLRIGWYLHPRPEQYLSGVAVSLHAPRQDKSLVHRPLELSNSKILWKLKRHLRR